MGKRLNETSKSEDEGLPPPPVVQRGPGRRTVNRPVNIRNSISSTSKTLAGSKRDLAQSSESAAINEPNKRQKSPTAPHVEVVPDVDLSRKSLPPVSGGVIEEIATNPPPAAVRASSDSGTQAHPMEVDSDDNQPRASAHNQCCHVVDDDAEEIAAAGGESARKGEKSGKSPNEREHVDPPTVDERGLLEDLSHIRAPEYTTSARDKTRAFRTHFSEPQDVPGQRGKVHHCNACKRKKAPKYMFTDEHSTLRCHMEASHEAKYTTWCKENNFESKLPKFLKAQKAADAASSRGRARYGALSHCVHTGRGDQELPAAGAGARRCRGLPAAVSVNAAGISSGLCALVIPSSLTSSSAWAANARVVRTFAVAVAIAVAHHHRKCWPTSLSSPLQRGVNL
ncbi:hypothetical protein AURDEDRAFT_178559 [Auricularia subglabra TFB-10046 SS5]|uniref:Uncharacterized protein n=1 Tax=Auricularia subglabra (strain TFB-10046 / SS5) TaxID=717982 RepID=J0L7R8_AURST|nr:hypothetical protein AURDEDRAFT_178559 [Auricularia subglabra TFB-10046 SS5]